MGPIPVFARVVFRLVAVPLATVAAVILALTAESTVLAVASAPVTLAGTVPAGGGVAMAAATPVVAFSMPVTTACSVDWCRFAILFFDTAMAPATAVPTPPSATNNHDMSDPYTGMAVATGASEVTVDAIEVTVVFAT